MFVATVTQARDLLDHVWSGREPYGWQRRLLESWFVAGRTPAALDVPTGLGKTSVVALWLAARATGAALPRRLVYVVDRRAVVDQATAEAEALVAALRAVLDDARIDTALRASWRRNLGLAPDELMPISTLRGAHRDNREALERPGSAAILIGTVDMIGSRLLFEGYGVSARMRPAHAALVGVDALIVLDEAHLARPFHALLEGVAAMRMGEAASPVPGLRVMTLSATPAKDSMDAFQMTEADAAELAVGARLRASKRIKLFDIDAGRLAEEVTERAIERARGGAGSSRVAIFCDSRKVAQDVSARLATRCKKEGWAAPVLLVGARRVFEREQVVGDLVFQRFAPGATNDPDPAFLVATSAGEVGVDLDADHIVCDLVPWERMVQRLGRVNRRPVPGHSLVDVFVAPSEKLRDAEARSDAARLATLRAPFELSAWTPDSEGRREASPVALAALRAMADVAATLQAASSADVLRPALTGPLVEAWAMTSLDEHPGRPLVAPWIRGWVEEEASTALVWRRHLPLAAARTDRERLRELERFLEAAAPHASETLDIPSFQAAAMLRKRGAAWRMPGEAVAVVLDPRGVVQQVLTAGDLANGRAERSVAGRTVILDARLGGLGASGLLDEAEDKTPLTLDAPEAEDWASRVGYRALTVLTDAVHEGWKVIYRWPLSDADKDAEVEELRVERRDDMPAAERPALARRAQTLRDHTDRIVAAARGLADRLGLPAEHAAVLEAAAAAHDLGKARPEWQRAMGAPLAGGPYAKTSGGGDPRTMLLGYRHEFGSLADMALEPAVQALPDEMRDLALHLVAAHHGHARPVIAPVDPDAPPSVSAARAREAALRFVRLQRRWGIWGLAWWEALLRAADWEASRDLGGEGA